MNGDEDFEEELEAEEPPQDEYKDEYKEETIAEVVEGEEKTAESKPSNQLDPKRIIEAALFISSKPLPLSLLGRFIGVAAPGFVENLVKQLAEEYDSSGSAIKIVSEPEGYVMRLRGEYASKVASLAQEAELSKGALKILAYISQNEGIEQSKVAERLGSTVYDYVRELAEKGFVSKEKKGRTSVLKTTQKFRDYFGA